MSGAPQEPILYHVFSNVLNGGVGRCTFSRGISRGCSTDNTDRSLMKFGEGTHGPAPGME